MARFKTLIVLITLLLFSATLHGALINGIVKKQGGAAIAGAQVKAVGFTTNSGDSLVFVAVTNAEGRYSMVIPHNSVFYFTAVKEGYQTAKVGPLHLADTVYTINFELIPNSSTGNLTTIKGFVYKQTGGVVSPLAGALVKITGSSANVSFSAFSDSAGRYTIVNIPYGTYLAQCQAAGHQTVTQTITLQSPTFELKFYLSPATAAGNTVSGKAFDDSTFIALSGVKVFLRSNDPAGFIFNAITNTAGAFSFAQVPNGIYNVTAQKEGYQPYVHNQVLIIDSNSNFNNLKLYLHKIGFANTSTVKGIVYKNSSSGQVPVNNAFVKLYGANTTLAFSTRTDSLGLFTMLNVPYGTYSAYCEAAGCQVQTQTITVQAPFTQLLFNLQTVNTGSSNVSGFVKDDSTQNPIANVKLSLFPNSVIAPVFTATSNTQGRFEFAQIPRGAYFLKAEKEGYEPYQHASLIIVDSIIPVNDLLIYLHKKLSNGTATVTGNVYEYSQLQNLPVANAVITIASANGVAFTAVSDSIGVFKILGVPFAAYQAHCTAPGYQQVTQTLTVNSPVVNLKFYLHRTVYVSAMVSGNVYDDSTRLGLGEVHLTLKPNGILPYLLTAVTDNTGYFKFTNVPPSEYTLFAEKAGYQSFVYPQTILISDSINITNIKIFLRKQTTTGFGTLLGKVYSKLNGLMQPIRNARVLLAGSDSLIYSAVTDSIGKYTIQNIKYGLYTANCSADGYAPVSTQLPINNSITEFPFYLMPILPPGSTAVIKGRVTFDAAANSAVKGAVIDFIPLTTTGSAVSVTTNAEGRYTGVVLPGSYHISCRFDNPATGYYYKEYYDNVQNIAQAAIITVAGYDTLYGKDFGIPPVPTGNIIQVNVKGKVTSDLGQVLANAKVSIIFIYYNNPVQYTAITDNNGIYSINMTLNNLDSMRSVIAVMAAKEGYKAEFYNEKSSMTLADKLQIFGDTTFSNINFTLEKVATGTTFSISGKVTGVQQTPVSSAFVIGVNVLNSEVGFAVTDALGKYALTNLKQGKYYLLFAGAGYIPEFYNNVLSWENATPVLVSGNVSGIDAELQAIISPTLTSNTITGIVSDEAGGALQGVLVVLKNNEGNTVNYTFTDVDGAYEMLGLDNGIYSLVATKVAYNSYAQSFQYSTQSGNTFVHNVSLTPAPVLDAEKEISAIPTSLKLMQNYPNPFNPSTRISYNIPVAGQVTLKIFDILGTELKTLVNKYQVPGTYEVTFNAAEFKSGVYIYQLTDGTNHRVLNKMLLIK
ncbi:MAG: carboxypeptidase regulatory-like domain-containing protein [Ignavibacteriales bacterium]|nr:carboxypeptidase regulatory-like domain-containing protein [Ignavibacteriales bacterium]